MDHIYSFSLLNKLNLTDLINNKVFHIFYYFDPILGKMALP